MPAAAGTFWPRLGLFKVGALWQLRVAVAAGDEEQAFAGVGWAPKSHALSSLWSTWYRAGEVLQEGAPIFAFCAWGPVQELLLQRYALTGAATRLMVLPVVGQVDALERYHAAVAFCQPLAIKRAQLADLHGRFPW